VVQGPLRNPVANLRQGVSRRRPPPLDAAVEAALDAAAAPARTDRLRAALVNLGRSVHRNRTDPA
jgi:hypothetical protein